MQIYTIGHSNLTTEEFIEILNFYEINVLVDVRAIPYSKFSSQYNKENISAEIKKTKIKYLFMGDLLGGPSKDEQYRLFDNSIDYERRSKEEPFVLGIERLLKGLGKGYKIALMCSEKEPDKCHRHLLIANKLLEKNIDVEHIISKNQTINAKNIPFVQKSLFGST